LCLDRLAPGLQTLDAALYEVIVSDDGVPTVEGLIAEKYPWAKWVAGPRRGPAANRNHGASQATGDWLVFTDDDCMPEPEWLCAYARNMDGRDVVEGRTSAYGVRSRLDEECPINETGGHLWSCNFGIRRDKFLELGGFDESFPSAAMEDIELDTRVNKSRLVRFFVPEATVFHPWRRRKGLQFARIHAASVANYVRLHPDAAFKFSFRSQLTSLIRSTKRYIFYSFKNHTYAGLIRNIYLDTCSYFFCWLAVRKVL
jgi:glycosyltransferase involved in cell wall biosynthesis